MPKPAGFIVGEPGTTEAEFVAERGVQLGDYVELEYEGYRVLAFVKSLRRVSRTVTADMDFKDVVDVVRFAGGGSLLRGSISILGLLELPNFPRVHLSNIFTCW